MSPEVRERVFEPFFTTKDVGKGSGLGLSQVYGFVRQSEGEVQLDSSVDQGSTFRLRLPYSREPAQQVDGEAAEAAVIGGSEKILLVEDDPTVLSLTFDLLTGLGYQVTGAANAAEALTILQTPAPFDLLFTDVVMPGGVSGVSLARSAREQRPGLAVLLTSGFIGEGAVTEEVGFPLLDKPYETAVVAAKVRQLLDARGVPAAAEAGSVAAE
jgi:CheY-like chemotaxis protein